MLAIPHRARPFLAPGKSRRKAIVSFGTLGASAALQMVAMLVVAKYLGPIGFGVYAGYIAATVVFTEAAGLGVGDVMVMTVSRNEAEGGMRLGRALGVGLAGALAFAPLCWLLLAATFPAVAQHPELLAFIAVELAASRVALTCEQYFVALSSPIAANIVRGTVPLLRVISLAALIGVFHGTITLFGWIMIVSAIDTVTAVAVLLAVRAVAGSFVLAVKAADIRLGVSFAIGQTFRMIQQNSDRLVLGAVLSGASFGIYAVASRVINAGMIPAQSYLRVTLPHFYRAGHEGLDGTIRYTKSIIFVVAWIIGLTTAAGLVVLVFVDHFLGRQYAGVALAGVALLPCLCFNALQYLLGDTLTGAGHVRMRTIVSVAMTIVSAGSYVAGAFLFGLWGAVFATDAAGLVSVLLLYFCVIWLNRPSRLEEGGLRHDAAPV